MTSQQIIKLASDTSKTNAAQDSTVKAFSQTDIKAVALLLEEAYKKTVLEGEIGVKVKICDITVSTKIASAKTGRNPTTGESLEIPERVQGSAKLPKTFKDAIKERPVQ